MLSFEVRVPVRAPVPAVWAAFTDWADHSSWIPLTRVRVTARPEGGTGQRFVARTAVGPVGFDDPMEVTSWHPPDPSAPAPAGRGVVRKLGPLVRGSAAWVVEPAAGGALLRWREEVDIGPAPVARLLAGPLAPLARAGGRLAFRLALGRFARRVERQQAGRG